MGDSDWWAAKRKQELAARSKDWYEWALKQHLLPYAHDKRMSEFDSAQAVEELRDHLLDKRWPSDANPAAIPGTVSVADGAQIGFLSGATLTVQNPDTATGSMVGQGTLVVNGAFSKGGSGTFAVRQGGDSKAPDLILNGPGTLGGGELCVGRSDSSDSDEPSMQIHGTFSLIDGPVAAALSTTPFHCTSGPRIHIHPGAELISDMSGAISSGTMIDNDGTITVKQGQHDLWGGTGGQTSDGDYIVEDDAKLQFGSCCADNFQLGPSAHIGGDGIIDMDANPMTLAAGATIDPAVLNLEFGQLNLRGSSPDHVALQDQGRQEAQPPVAGPRTRNLWLTARLLGRGLTRGLKLSESDST